MTYIDVRPGTRPGTYTASLGGRHLVTSRQPFLDAARILLQEGASPNDILVMRWIETATESLRATIGAAAALTVWEPDRGQPHFAKWKPRQSSVVAPPMRSISSRVSAAPYPCQALPDGCGYVEARMDSVVTTGASQATTSALGTGSDEAFCPDDD